MISTVCIQIHPILSCPVYSRRVGWKDIPSFYRRRKTFRAKVIRQIIGNDPANHQKIKFPLEIGEGDYDEIMMYNELSDLLKR
jgi:hypothetical protein